MFWRRPIERADGIEVGPSPLHDRGVMATRAFGKGETIERAPVVFLSADEWRVLRHTVLFDYYFLIDDVHTPAALGLGFSSLYNHATPANAAYAISKRHGLIEIRADRAIGAGEEITLNYNGRPGDAAPIVFPDRKGA